jgi:aspartyl protease family protein
MGQFRVTATLTGPTGIAEAIDLLVDTGATFVVLPPDVAARLALRPNRVARVDVAGGRQAEWAIADLRIRIGAFEAPTPCMISEGGTPLLGAVALESLLLAVDPVRMCLVPANALAMVSAG